jgi:PilZ domain
MRPRRPPRRFALGWFVMDRFVEKLTSDRRFARRHSVNADLRIHLRGPDTAQKIVRAENLSQRGVFFSTSLRLTKGIVLDLFLNMPEGITGVRAAQWLCVGHVVRVVPVEALADTRGVGVQFDFYEVSSYQDFSLCRLGWSGS